MITVKGLTKSFGALTVLDRVNAEVKDGECIALIGPSGAGKSVFLTCLNALTRPDAGQVLIDGVDIYDKRTDINEVRERMGMVYQTFNLFTHMDVLSNITLAPMKIKKWSRQQAERKADELLERVSLTDKRCAMPEQLSGGQKQRIAIARAMAMEPKIVLFDEPTSALDPSMVGEVLSVIRAFAKEGLTMLIVTHEMEFAREVADRVFYLDEKRIYETGTPTEIFDAPKGEKTRAFIGRLKSLNLLIDSHGFDLLSFSSKIEQFAIKYSVERRRAYSMQLAFEELSVYLLKTYYGRAAEPHLEVQFDYGERSKLLSMQLEYAGRAFNPFTANSQDDEALGIHMIERIAKSTEYSYTDTINKITLSL